MLMGITDKKTENTIKKAIAQMYRDKNAYRVDELEKPLKKATRWIYDSTPYSETCYEYGFLKGTDYTDEELQEWKETEWCYINSWYDCTGEWFTRWIHTHRNPNGTISFVHCKGLDI